VIFIRIPHCQGKIRNSSERMNSALLMDGKGALLSRLRHCLTRYLTRHRLTAGIRIGCVISLYASSSRTSCICAGYIRVSVKAFRNTIGCRGGKVT